MAYNLADIWCISASVGRSGSLGLKDKTPRVVFELSLDLLLGWDGRYRYVFMYDVLKGSGFLPLRTDLFASTAELRNRSCQELDIPNMHILLSNIAGWHRGPSIQPASL